MKRSLRSGLILVVIALGFYLAVYLKTTQAGFGNPHFFFHPDNLTNLLGQAAIVGILACGMTLVIISGHIDLSVGSMLGMLGAIAAWGMSAQIGWGVSPVWAVLFVLLLGTCLGAGQGALVAWARIPAFVVTLGGLLMFRGVLLLVAKRTIPIESTFMSFLGAGQIIGLPVRFILMLVMAVIVGIVCKRLRFGRYLYAIGGNREAAHYSGIRVERHVCGVFAIMGCVAALAGLVASGVQMAAAPGAGDLMELYAIAACVIGGTSLAGGRGSVWGSVIGALIMATIRNGLSCLGVASAGEKIVLGLILITAVGLDLRLSRQSSSLVE